MSGLDDLTDLAPPCRPAVVGPLPRQETRGPKPRKPLPRSNPKRLAERREAQDGPQAALCRRRPCCLCGRRPAVPHHVRTKGAGGLDSDCAPVCLWCHDAIHTQGTSAVEKKHGVKLEEVADALAAELAARPEHDCEAHAVLREDASKLASRYVCDRCGYVLPDEQEGGES